MREAEEFRLVTRRKKRGFSTCKRAVGSRLDGNDGDDTDVDYDTVFRKLLKAENELKESSYCENVFCRLGESLSALNVDGIAEILCYGLGQFSHRKAPKYQLALLMCLKRYYGSRAYVYDPAFLATEIKILQRLGFEVIDTNEEGKRTVDDKVTLVYLPHCPTHLTNNFLYANWGRNLSNCILMANSFNSLIENQIQKYPSTYVDYVTKIRPYVTEIALRNDFSYMEAFNDFTIHIFPEDDIDKVSPSFWASREEPNYENVNIEFIIAEETERLHPKES